MIQRRSRRMLAIVVVVLTVAGLTMAEIAEAQTFGRVKFIVKKPTGEAVQGVKQLVEGI